VYYPLLVLGIIGAGCVYTGKNPLYTTAELEYAMRTADEDSAVRGGAGEGGGRGCEGGRARKREGAGVGVYVYG
jgi:hypothetical protein